MRDRVDPRRLGVGISDRTIGTLARNRVAPGIPKSHFHAQHTVTSLRHTMRVECFMSSMRVHVCVYMYVCVCVCIRTCVCVWIYIHTICIYICVVQACAQGPVMAMEGSVSRRGALSAFTVCTVSLMPIAARY